MRVQIPLLTSAVLLLTGCTAKIIQNEPKPAPKLILDPDIKDFYQFTKDSFRLENYEYYDLDEKIPVAE